MKIRNVILSFEIKLQFGICRGCVSWGAQKEKGAPIPRRILNVRGKKRIRKNIVTSAKKRCVYRLINRLSAQATK